MSIEMQIEGLGEVLKKLSPELYAAPLRRFWERMAEEALNDARLWAPVDTGRLKSSLAKEIDPQPAPLWARIGTNVEHEGVSYPRALDESERYHYRGTSHRGLPTKGWFSGVLTRARPAFDRWVVKCKEEIGQAWAR